MKSAKCANCGFVGWAEAELCKRCGASMSSAPVDAGERPVVDHPAPYSNYGVTGRTKLRTGLAVTALVSGIMNLTCLSVFVVPLIVGIVISVVALKKVDRYPHEYGGKPLAVAGLVINLVAVLGLPIMLAVAIPNLLASRIAANEASAMMNMRTIHEAEQRYQSRTGGEYGTLIDLEQAILIQPELASGTKSGYRFSVEVKGSRSYAPAQFTVVAVPIKFGSSGRRSFFIDETGVLREDNVHGVYANRSSRRVED